jgi:hypothetical protein
MSATRFGELLGRYVPLSRQDVAEILEEQAVSHRRFGQIAMSWGLCEPEHVCRAWCEQLAHNRETVDLKAVGLDTQAISQMTGTLAREFGVIPIRSLSDRLILAATPATLDRAAERLPGLIKKQVQFVLADAAQIAAAIEQSYPTTAIEESAHPENTAA